MVVKDLRSIRTCPLPDLTRYPIRSPLPDRIRYPITTLWADMISLPPMEAYVDFDVQEGLRSDKDMLRDGLVHFFPDDKSDEAKEHIKSAEVRFMDAVDQRGLSPYVAFKEVIRTTALAEEMDTLHASLGGLDFYIINGLDVRTDAAWFNKLSEASRIEAKNAVTRRKVQEIKRLMAREQTRHVNGNQPVEELQITNGDGQGQENETEQS